MVTADGRAGRQMVIASFFWNKHWHHFGRYGADRGSTPRPTVVLALSFVPV